MPYVIKKRRKFYAILDIPASLRHHYAGRTKLIRTLKTDSPSIAARRAAVLVASWKAEFERLRGGNDDLAFFRALPAGPIREAAIALEVGNRASPSISTYADDPEAGEKWEEAAQEAAVEAEDFRKRATGEITPFTAYVDEWLARQNTKQKTKDQAKKDIERFSVSFPTLQDIDPHRIQDWADGLDIAPGTIKRQLSSLRTYWKYIARRAKAVDRGSKPFDDIDLPKKANGIEDRRKPFEPKDVIRLMMVAHRAPLKALIQVAMFQGMRLEEIASLKVEDCSLAAPIPFLTIKDAKSRAGNRSIPIHPLLLPAMQRLCRDSQDGYLIAEQKADRYGDRGNVLGHAFGALKRKLGYGNALNFHSIRRTFVTLLENAGCAEGTIADLVGHQKPRLTLGLYSGGNSLTVMAEAIKRLSYHPDMKPLE